MIDHLLLFWLSVAFEASRGMLEDLTAIIRHILVMMEPRIYNIDVPQILTGELDPDLIEG